MKTFFYYNENVKRHSLACRFLSEEDTASLKAKKGNGYVPFVRTESSTAALCLGH